MQFAESARLRCALFLSVAVTAGLAIAAWPSHGSESRGPVQRMRGCGTGHRAQQSPPPAQAAETQDPYVAMLRSAAPALEACMVGHEDLQVRLAVDLDGTGKVTNVEVKTIATDVAAIDLKVVKCVQTAVAPLQFPADGNPKRISTFLRP